MSQSYCIVHMSVFSVHSYDETFLRAEADISEINTSKPEQIKPQLSDTCYQYFFHVDDLTLMLLIQIFVVFIIILYNDPTWIKVKKRVIMLHWVVMSPLNILPCLWLCNANSDKDRQVVSLVSCAQQVTQTGLWILPLCNSSINLSLSPVPCRGMSNSRVRKSFNLDPWWRNDPLTQTGCVTVRLGMCSSLWVCKIPILRQETEFDLDAGKAWDWDAEMLWCRFSQNTFKNASTSVSIFNTHQENMHA